MGAGPVRIGLIGCGHIGRKHTELIRTDSVCELVGVADPSPASEGFATANGARWFADHESMLDAVRPDAVIVASPNAVHVDGALDCIARGMPVLVEKPIADSVVAARELINAAERARVPLLVGHHRRYNPIIECAREVVASGRLGALTAVSAQWLLQKPADYFDARWRREAGGGPILINLIHDIDDLRFVCGEIDLVQAFTANAARGFAVEDTAAISVRFASGALGTITLSDSVPAPWSWEIASGENPAYPTQPTENCYLVCGRDGSLALPTLDLWNYASPGGWRAPLERERLTVEHADPLPRQLRHFCSVVRGTETPRIDGRDGARTLAVVEAIMQAARSGACARPTPI